MISSWNSCNKTSGCILDQFQLWQDFVCLTLQGFYLTVVWDKLQRRPLSISAAGIIERRLWIEKMSPPNMVLSTSTLLIVWRKMLESWLQILMVSTVIPILKNVNPSMPVAMKDQCSMGLATQCSNPNIMPYLTANMHWKKLGLINNLSENAVPIGFHTIWQSENNIKSC